MHCINVAIINSNEIVKQELTMFGILYREKNSFLVFPQLEDTEQFIFDCGVDSYVLVSTDYFSGVGNQSATCCHRSSGDLEYITLFGDDSINKTLALLGVKPTSDMDAFDYVGLGEFRSNDDI